MAKYEKGYNSSAFDFSNLFIGSASNETTLESVGTEIIMAVASSQKSWVLDLGCGMRKVHGAIGIDCSLLPSVDIIVNLDSLPYPFPDNTFSSVYCNHALEHLVDWIAALREINRILRPGGTINIRVPYFASSGSFRDPTHRHFFTLETFDYFSEDGQQRLSVLNYYSRDLRFQVGKRLIFGRLHRFLGAEVLFNRFPHFYENFLCYLFPARELWVVLQTLKK